MPALDAVGNDEARSRSICLTELSPEALASLYKEPERVKLALSITHGAIFAGYARDFLKQNKLDGQSPDVVLRGTIKVKYLEYLKERGLNGIYSFLTTFVASLAGTSARHD